MATPKAPTMLAVGRRRGFETTLEPESGAISVSARTPTIFGTGGGSTGLSAEGVNGAIEEGTEIVISALSGESFGTGPTTVLFDPLSGGTNGATVSTSNPLVGSYSNTENAFFSNSEARSGGTSVKVYQPDGNGKRALRTSWAQATVVAARYWIMFPAGTAIPGAVVGGYSTPTSNMKILWMGINSSMNGGTDICLPTFDGGTACSLTGNGNTQLDADGCTWQRYPTGSGTIQSHFRYGDWTMVEVLEDADTPTVRVMHCGATIGVQRYTKSDASNYWGDSTSQFWSHANIPGYIRVPSGHANSSGNVWPDTHIYIADFAIKTGSGAWADVFFINSSSIDTATDIRHAQISSWSTSSITCTPRGVSSVDLDGWYVVIRKADDTYLTPRLIS